MGIDFTVRGLGENKLDGEVDLDLKATLGGVAPGGTLRAAKLNERQD